MGKIIAEIYSCNKHTYSPICHEAINLAFEKINKRINKNDIEIHINDLSDNGTKEIQQQRSPEGEHARIIKVYEEGRMLFLIGLSNTNFDEDIRLERLVTKRKNVYGKTNYHANTYLFQGINKIFEKYFNYKEQFPNLKLFFYLLDTNESYPHNQFNLLSYRMLSTIGFSILNLHNIDFSEFQKFGFIPDKNLDIEYKSFNKLMNDKIVISSSNSGNIPGYLKCVEVPISEEMKTYRIEKYIYTFKALGAGAYDSFLWIWTLKKLANMEKKSIEFHFSIENYNLNPLKKNKKQTKKLPGPVVKLLEKIGVDVTYETSAEILQNQKTFVETSFLRSIKSGEIRNQEYFRNNLREKGILTKCAVCDCEIEDLLDAAHIWGIKEIKAEDARSLNSFINSTSLKVLFNQELNQEIEFKRYILANSGDNGIWLCKNHHGAFDKYLFSFSDKDGAISFNNQNVYSFEKIAKYLSISESNLSVQILNNNTKAFLTKRNLVGVKPILVE